MTEHQRTRARQLAGIVLVLLLAFGGFWFWNDWVRETPKLDRSPIAQDPLPGNSLPADLEALAPQGAAILAGARNLTGMWRDFKSSNLFKLYETYHSSAQARAAEIYSSANLKFGTTSPQAKILSNVFGKSFLIVVYPAANSIQPVSFTPAVDSSPPMQDPMPRSMGRTVPPILFLTRCSSDTSLESLMNSLSTSAGPLFSPAERKPQIYNGAPLAQIFPGIFITSVKQESGTVFALSNDVDKIKASVDLSRKGADVRSMAQTNWVGQAMKRIPSNAFSYTLTKDDSLSSLNMTLQDIPAFTDWSVASLTWNKGLETAGFFHLSSQPGNPLRDWAILGPAPCSILSYVPEGSFILLATNSLSPENTVKFIQAYADKFRGYSAPLAEFIKENASAFSKQLGEQAAVSYYGLKNVNSSLEHDAVLVLEFRSRLKAELASRMIEKSLSEGIENVEVRKNASADSGSEFELTMRKAGAAQKKVFFAIRNRMLLAATTRDGLNRLLQNKTGSERGAKDFIPPGLSPKSNYLILTDTYGLYKNVLTMGLDSIAIKSASDPGMLSWKEWLFSALELFSGFKTGGTVFLNTSEGIASQSVYPYQDLSVQAWATKLQAFQPIIEKSVLLNAKMAFERESRAKRQHPKNRRRRS